MRDLIKSRLWCKMTSSKYRVASYKNGDEKDIQELFSIAFGGRVFPLDSWVWRFKKNPCLKECITTLWDGNLLIAHTALTPSFVWYEGKNIIAAVSGTTMARPEYLGISLDLYSSCSNMYSNIDMIYGWANKNTFRITTKYLKHHFIGDMYFWTAKPVCKDYDESSICKIDCFNEVHSKLHEHLIMDHVFIVKRDVSYLNWRFRDKPSSGYEIFQHCTDEKVDGYMVLNTYKDNEELHGQIIDIVAPAIDTFESMLKYAKNYFAKKKCSHVKLWMSSIHYKKILECAGFELGLHRFPTTIWDRDLNLSQMYITMADSDIF